MLSWIEQATGIALVLLILLDVFLTVLYARIGAGIVGYRMALAVWRGFRSVARYFGKNRGAVLSFCGPVILVLLVALWAFGLTLGTALVVHPHLGTAIRAASGEPTPTDFITALYGAAGSISIVGGSGLEPQTMPFRFYFLFNSLIGLSILSLTLTYLMQVYSALLSRNALGIKLWVMTRNTGDAAELVARVGARGNFSAGYTNLSEVAGEIVQVKESHHFYPVLFYFRFRETYYSASQIALIALDSVSLMRSALDQDEFGWLQDSSALDGVWEGSFFLLTTLEGNFLKQGEVPPKPPDDVLAEKWRERYLAGVRRLQAAGIRTRQNLEAGAAQYINLRTKWHSHITNLAPAMLFRMDEIDPALPDERRHLQLRKAS